MPRIVLITRYSLGNNSGLFRFEREGVHKLYDRV